jgi:hypothetical protein
MKKCILNFSRETLMERLLGRGLEDNTKTDVKDIKWEGVDWINFTQNSLLKGREIRSRNITST